MLNIIIYIISVIAIIGWLKYKVAFVSMVEYIKLKNYETPTTEEIQLCNKNVPRNFFKTKAKGGKPWLRPTTQKK